MRTKGHRIGEGTAVLLGALVAASPAGAAKPLDASCTKLAKPKAHLVKCPTRAGVPDYLKTVVP